jgi:DnaK suppressor protein
VHPGKRKEIEARLHAMQRGLLAEKERAAEDIAPVELDQSRVGRLSRMDDIQRQAMAQELDRRRDVQLQRIEGAFQRLENDTYGLCSKCGKTINERRLEFDPTVFFCIDCAQRAERR